MWRRLGINVFPSAALLGAIAWSTSTSRSPSADVGSGNLLTLSLALALIGHVAFVLIRAGRKRAEFRRNLVRALYVGDHDSDDGAGDGNGGAEAEDDARGYVRGRDRDIGRAHASCCCCYSSAGVVSGDGDDEPLPLARRVHPATPERGGDLCSCLWACLKRVCCGGCCGCWLMCCGLCAIAQEAAEVDGMAERMVTTIGGGGAGDGPLSPAGTPGGTHVDYVTFQPWYEYFSKIDDLRNAADGEFVAHCWALSDLSTGLLRGLAGALVALALFALTDIDSNFTFENMMVVS